MTTCTLEKEMITGHYNYALNVHNYFSYINFSVNDEQKPGSSFCVEMHALVYLSTYNDSAVELIKWVKYIPNMIRTCHIPVKSEDRDEIPVLSSIFQHYSYLVLQYTVSSMLGFFSQILTDGTKLGIFEPESTVVLSQNSK